MTVLTDHSAVKRAFDVVVSASALLVLTPVLIGCAAVIFVKMGLPVFFIQRRPGLQERPFTLIKFRTMDVKRASDGTLLPDGARLTGIGRALRRSSLDEIPTLFNVLIGDMSLVGPRPLLVRYLPFYTDKERLRFSVRPGITGLAQVRGRNLLSWTDRLAADVEYVENWSLWLDVSILARTIQQVVRGEGVIEDPNTALKDLDEERAGGGSS